MTTLYIVLPLALVIATFSVLAFAWSVHTGQLDDLETPAHRLLLDDEDRATFALPAASPATHAFDPKPRTELLADLPTSTGTSRE